MYIEIKTERPYIHRYMDTLKWFRSSADASGHLREASRQ